MLAISLDFDEGVELLVKHGASHFVRTDEGLTAMHLCCEEDTNRLKYAKLLLRGGQTSCLLMQTLSDVSYAERGWGLLDSKGKQTGRGASMYDMTPLHMAIGNGHIDLVMLFLTQNSKLTQKLVCMRNTSDSTPLTTAIEAQQDEMVGLLLMGRADPNAYS